MISNHYRLMLFTVGCFNCLLCSLSTVIIPAMGAVVERELNITHASFGLAMGFFLAGVIMGYLPFLVLSGPVWIGRMIKSGIALLVMANLASVIPSFGAVLFGRFAFGVAWACAAMAASLITVQYFERNQHNLFCIIHAAFLGGLGIGMYLAPPASALFGRWQTFSLLLAGISGVLLMVSGIRPVAWAVEKRPSPVAAFLNCIMQKRVVLMIILLSVYCILETAISYFCAVCAQMEKGMSLSQATRIVALFLFGIVGGRLIFVFWIRWQPTVSGIAGLVGAGCVFVFTALLMRGFPVPAGAMFLAGIFFGPVYPLGIAYAVGAIAKDKDIVVSAGNIIINLACLFGMLAVGWIGDWLSLQAGLLMFCVLLAASAALIGFAGRREKQTAD